MGIISHTKGHFFAASSRPSDSTTPHPARTTRAEFNRDDVQGDLFSRGFPKFTEIYYFFHIKSGKEEFCQKVKMLVSGEEKHISSINKVLEDWKQVDGAAAKNRTIVDPAKKEWVSTVNALIAFSKLGLDSVSDQTLR